MSWNDFSKAVNGDEFLQSLHQDTSEVKSFNLNLFISLSCKFNQGQLTQIRFPLLHLKFLLQNVYLVS